MKSTSPDEAKAEPAPPCILVIHGASGDLTQRKLIPALYFLDRDGYLPKNFAVVGTSRTEVSEHDFRAQALESIRAAVTDSNQGDPAPSSRTEFDAKVAKALIDRFHYLAGDSTKIESYQQMKQFLAKLDQEHQTQGNILFYLATPPALFKTIPQFLAEVGLLKQESTEKGRSQSSWRRVVIEKPFGSDLESARALNRELLGMMTEDQIYRIDHYLGKETVRNILALRFANTLFEPHWNRNYIESVQITVSETVGVGSRAAYYDHAGALRDMLPNHLFQLVSLIGMEAPNSFDADQVRDEKLKVIQAIKPYSAADIPKKTVRAQYSSGKVEGKPVPGYHGEKDVPAKSQTETYAALKLEIDNWRWAGVPFYLRTGKSMAMRLTEIVILFKTVPFHLFRESGCAKVSHNRLVLQIQPEERIDLEIQAKKPGPLVRLGTVDLGFDYQKTFGQSLQTGYETLLYDCMIGDPTLFQRADQVEAAWKVVMPILESWAKPGLVPLETYEAGSWGPEGADRLIRETGQKWSSLGMTLEKHCI